MQTLLGWGVVEGDACKTASNFCQNYLVVLSQTKCERVQWNRLNIEASKHCLSTLYPEPLAITSTTG